MWKLNINPKPNWGCKPILPKPSKGPRIGGGADPLAPRWQRPWWWMCCARRNGQCAQQCCASWFHWLYCASHCKFAADLTINYYMYYFIISFKSTIWQILILCYNSGAHVLLIYLNLLYKFKSPFHDCIYCTFTCRVVVQVK